MEKIEQKDISLAINAYNRQCEPTFNDDWNRQQRLSSRTAYSIVNWLLAQKYGLAKPWRTSMREIRAIAKKCYTMHYVGSREGLALLEAFKQEIKNA